jgi:exosome complex RNA-binding protein Csl4
METKDIAKCVKCGGEMKEVNADMMKCEDCGSTVNKNEEVKTEDATKI